MPTKIAIIGTAPTSRDLAPYDDPSWQIWACSPGNQGGALKRITVWFELHAIAEMMATENKGMSEPYFGWLKTMATAKSFQVVMTELNDYVPDAIPFPRDEMLHRFGNNWFTSSIAWMMALAISRMQPGDTLALFGVDMAADQENYTHQKAGCIRFMEFAKDKGIDVQVPMESCLAVPPPLYGYSEGTHMGRRIKSVQHMCLVRRAEMAAQYDRLGREIAFFDGALEQMRYFERTWLNGAEMPLRLGKWAELEEKVLAELRGASGVAAPQGGQGAGAAAVDAVAAPVQVEQGPMSVFSPGAHAPWIPGDHFDLVPAKSELAKLNGAHAGGAG